MNRVLILSLGALLALAVTTASAQTASPAQGPQAAPRVVGPNFVDNNGDGICDLYQSGARPGSGMGRGYGRGRGNGTHVGPQDGTGYGPGPAAGGGTCDGTGPKGKGRGPRR